MASDLERAPRQCPATHRPLCAARRAAVGGVGACACGRVTAYVSHSVTAPSSETRRTAEAQCLLSFVSVRLKTRSDTTLTRNDALLVAKTHTGHASSLFPLPSASSLWSTAPSGCSLVDLPSDATFSAPRPSARPALACSPDSTAGCPASASFRPRQNSPTRVIRRPLLPAWPGSGVGRSTARGERREPRRGQERRCNRKQRWACLSCSRSQGWPARGAGPGRHRHQRALPNSTNT